MWRVLGLLAVLTGCATIRAPDVPLAPDWASVLAARVDREGRVDFAGIAAAPAPIEAVVRAVAGRDPADEPSRAGQLAAHANAYNALAMYGVVRAGIPRRLDLLGRVRFFKLTRFVIGGRAISLYDYENDVIRPIGEPRIHFALNCMVVSCPRLPRQPFTAAALDAELDEAARLFFSEPRNLTVDDASRTVFFSAILDFYTEDFLKAAPSLIAYANRYRAVPIPLDYTIAFFAYDWTINAE